MAAVQSRAFSSSLLSNRSALRVSSKYSVTPSLLSGLNGVSGALKGEQKRFLNLHEYQSKDLMNRFGVRVQKGYVADSAEQAYKHAQGLLEGGAIELVIKAQIHAGGRGKGVFDSGFKGGVHVVKTAEEVRDIAASMLGNSLVTKQTGPEGQKTLKVLVHEGIFFDKEYYFAILMDRAHNGPVLVASPQGGMDIEEVAESDPDAIHSVSVDIKDGISDSHTSVVCKALGIAPELEADAKLQMTNMYNLFRETDATQVEINPLVETTDGKVYCVDAKITFDGSAEFRQKEIFSWRDTSMEDSREVAASAFDLNYIGLDGNIGCMVNGAGLAMATMDIIQHYGGSPANFLDVGGSANETQVEEAFRILNDDPQCKAVLVNIFGGIMKCDVIAQGIVNAAKNINLSIPLIVRLEGTNVELGKEILANSGLAITTANDLDDAAQKAVKSIE